MRDDHRATGKGLQRFGEGGNLPSPAQPDLAQGSQGQADDALRPARQPAEVIVVKHHHLARAAALNVQLDPVRALGHGAPEGGQGVFGFERARPAVGKHEGPRAIAGQEAVPKRRVGGHQARAL